MFILFVTHVACHIFLYMGPLKEMMILLKLLPKFCMEIDYLQK